MSRFTQAIALATAGLALLQGTAHAGVLLGVPLGTPLSAPLGGTLGDVLGTPLPFAGGGVLAIAAAAVVAGIYLKRRKR